MENQAHPQVVEKGRKAHARERAEKHHALDGDVDHARPLAEQAAHRSQSQGGGCQQCGLDHSRQVQAGAAGHPHQEGKDRQQGQSQREPLT
jgi:hypothetical protein